MLRKLLALTLVLGATAGIASLGSALFTDTASVSANTFTTGTVDISTDKTTALVTFANMAPGDEVSGGIMVSNAGSLPMRYAIVATATNTDTKSLMTQLDLTIYSGVTVVSCTDKTYAGGTVIYATGDIGSLAGINLVGDPAPAQQTGDRLLAVAAAEALPLCFAVKLPTGTSNAFQGASTTVTFDFIAEQTTNN